jgi:hypothetical protein
MLRHTIQVYHRVFSNATTRYRPSSTGQSIQLISKTYSKMAAPAQDPALASRTAAESTIVDKPVPSVINEVAAKEGAIDGDAAGGAMTKTAGEFAIGVPTGDISG